MMHVHVHVYIVTCNPSSSLREFRLNCYQYLQIFFGGTRVPGQCFFQAETSVKSIKRKTYLKVALLACP